MPKFDDFNAGKESFWEERLQQYFIANDTKNGKKVANLITFMGAKTYDTLKIYLFPDTPAMKTYHQLVTILTARYAPATSVIYERYRFHSRNQQVEEPLEQYVKEIKVLSKSCKFENFLDQALRDRTQWYPILSERIEHIPFKFDPIGILPLCQQTELLYSMFKETNEKICLKECSVDKANKLLLENFLEHLGLLHDHELELTKEDSDRFTQEVLLRHKNKHPHVCPISERLTYEEYNK